MDRWSAGSGYLIGGRLVLTAAHTVDYRQDLRHDEQLLVRTIAGRELAARVVLVCDEPSQVDLALLEIRDPRFDEHLRPVGFAQVNRDSPAPVPNCWAVGFPRFGEAGAVLAGGSRRETWQVGGEILPGGKLRAGLLSLRVTSTPQQMSASLAGSAWEGMSGAVVFTSDPHDGELAVGVVALHHRPEGESALTVVPLTALAGLPPAADWWHLLGVADPATLPVLPPPSAADERRSRLAGARAMKEHWDPRARGVEQAARPGWFFTGRRQALSQLVNWLTAAPGRADNVRVVTGGPGSGKSAVLARLVTMSDPQYRADIPRSLAADDPVADLAPGVIHVAVHARTAPTDEVVNALAVAAGAPQADLYGLIETLLERPEAFTIAVDALDEADDPAALALALRRLASETADAGVRLLVGTRPGGPYRRLITALGLRARDNGPALIDLDTPAYLARDDLAGYVRRRLLLTDVPPAPGRPDTPYRGRETLAGQVADAVARAAYPAFLIGQLVSRALLLRTDPLSPGDPFWQHFPATVAAAMDVYLASVGDQKEQDRVEDLLRPLAYARGDGLPHDDTGLWPLLATALAQPGRSYTVGDVTTLLDTAADYLVETVITGQAAYYRLYHEALADRLRERDQQHSRPVSAAQTIYQCLLGTVAPCPDGTRNWTTAHPYLHSQLAGHAARAGMIDDLLSDDAYLLHADLRRLIPAATTAATTLGRDRARLLRRAPRAIDAPPAARAALFSVTETHNRLGDTYRTLATPTPYRAVWAALPPRMEETALEGHTNWVLAVCALSVGGQVLLASGGGDGTVHLWDPATGDLVRTLGGGIGQVFSFAMCTVPVGGRALLVTGSDDRTVHLWDPATGDRVRTLDRRTGRVLAVCTVPVGGRVLLATAGRGRTVRLWDPATGKLVRTLGGRIDEVSSMCTVSVGGQVLLATAGSAGPVRLWDPATGEIVRALTGHTGPVNAICTVSVGGRVLLASGGGGGTVHLWDPATGKQVRKLDGHADPVYTVCTVSVGEQALLATAGPGRTVRLWDPTTGKLMRTLDGHTSSVHAMCTLSVGGRVLLATGGDLTVRLWDPARGELARALGGHAGKVYAMCPVPVGGRVLLATGGDLTVRLWDPVLGKPLRALHGHTDPDPVYTVLTLSVGRRILLAASGRGRTVPLWDPVTGELVRTLDVGTGDYGTDWVNQMCTVPLGGRVVLATGGGDRAVRLWDPATGEQVGTADHTDPVTAVCPVFVGEEALLAFGGDAVRLWDPATGEIARTLEGHTDSVRAMCTMSVGGRALLATGGDDGAVRLWDPATGELVRTLYAGGAATGIRAVCTVAAAGRALLAAGGYDSTVRLWDLDDLHLRLEIPVPDPVRAITQANGLLITGLATGLLALKVTLDHGGPYRYQPGATI
jgi:WD40 repeat protein